MIEPIPYGKYYLLDRINSGGMAEVFRAKAFGVEGFERIVAVKRILPNIAADGLFIKMFIDEAKIAVQLNHANIAQIFDLGKVGSSYFIALEYVHGKDARAIFDKARSFGEPVPIGMACHIVMKACEGLDYAHNKRDSAGQPLELVHRDVSPQNVLVSFDGDVKLIDFGIAKAAGKESRTRAGILKGKFGYLSPEQVRGERLDRRSDIFSLGTVLHELLTGRRLFAGESDFASLQKVRTAEIAPPSFFNDAVPAELSAIVLEALERDRDRRFQTAMELQERLNSFLRDRGESFGRRDVSAWMHEHFPEDAEHDQETLGSLDELGPSHTHQTAVTPIGESIAVVDDIQEIPSEGSSKSTLLGMSALAKPPGGRTVPPPPPRGRAPLQSTPPRGRTVPPPPPRRTLQGMPEANTPVAPLAAMPAAATPGSSPPQFWSEPDSSGSYAEVESAEPVAAAPDARPALEMDWDDEEEMSTQIYDRPEEELSLDEFDPSPRGGLSQASVPTYIPPPPRSVRDDDSIPSFGTPPPARNLGPSSLEPFGDLDGYADPYAQPAPFHDTNSQFYVAPPQGFQPAAAPQPAPSVLPAPPAQPSPAAMHVTQTIPAPRTGSRAPLYALAAGAVALLCFVGYIFLVQTEPGVVQLTTQPADVSVTLDGEAIGETSPFVVTGVSPGQRHILEVKKDGYRSWSQEVQVQPGQTLKFPVTLEPDRGPPTTTGAAATVGGFTLETQPAGASVFLDGEELAGKTPLRVGNLVGRSYDVRIELAGYKSHTMSVGVVPAVDKTLPAVTMVPKQVRLRISSDPTGADAMLHHGEETRDLGKTPVDVTLDNDSVPWELRVTKAGHEPFTKELAFEGGSNELAVRALLDEAGGSAPAKAQAAPRAAKPAARRASRPARPAPAAAAEPAAAEGTGTLRVNSRPWAQVSVDGKSFGTTPQMNIQLPAGSHKVQLVNPDFGIRKTVTVNIKPDAVETMIIELQE